MHLRIKNIHNIANKRGGIKLKNVLQTQNLNAQKQEEQSLIFFGWIRAMLEQWHENLVETNYWYEKNFLWSKYLSPGGSVYLVF